MSDPLTPVHNALDDLERALQDAYSIFGAEPTEDMRWRLHVLACSLKDFTFWVRQIEDGRWVATEVETGVSGEPAETPRAALALYWEGQS